MVKKITAVILGVVAFFLMFAVGETFGAPIGLGFVAVYFLFSQLFLSRGNDRALYEDWPLMLLLNAAVIVTAVMILFIEPDAKWTSVVAVISIAGSVIGAGVAAWFAKAR